MLVAVVLALSSAASVEQGGTKPNMFGMFSEDIAIAISVPIAVTWRGLRRLIFPTRKEDIRFFPYYGAQS